jgi:hypothetical protein
MKRSRCFHLLVGGLLFVSAGWVSVARADLILNGSFESPAAPGPSPPESTPDNWNFFTSGPDSSGVKSTVYARTGGQVLQFFTPENPAFNNSFQGYFQNTNIALGVGSKLIYSAYVRSDPGLPFNTNAIGKIGIEFRQGFSEVYRIEQTWQPSDLSTGEWRLFVIDTVSTAVVDNVNFTIVLANGSGTNANGIFWVDDVSAATIPEPSLLGLLLAGSFIAHAAHRKFHRKSK